MADDDLDLSSRFAPIITVVVLLVAGSLVPKGDVAPTKDRLARRDAVHRKHKIKQKEVGVALASGLKKKAPRPRVEIELAKNDRADLSAYEDLGSWIDIYDAWPWRNPERAVRILDSRGVQTIFLQTSNYGLNRTMFKRRQTARFLEAAHRRKMKVVAWTVPSFAQRKVDYGRARAAITFERRGHSFDSFGLDIEAAIVADVSKRNRSLLHLSKRLRRLVGPDYTLAAITPDPVEADYWPNFPYKSVNHLYDVFVPMGYFSFRADGYKGVKKYTLASIRNIREASSDPNAPIHFIGGIGGETTVREVKGFVNAVRAKNLIGASYYDFVATSREEWEQLESIVQEPAPKPEEEVDEPDPALPEPRPTALERPEKPEKQHVKKAHKKKGHQNNKRVKHRKHGKKHGKKERQRNRRRHRRRN